MHERPRGRGPAVRFVVSFDVTDAVTDGALVEAKAFVEAVGPDRAAGAEAVADGVLRTLHHIADGIGRCADNEVNVPSSDRERKRRELQAFDE